MKTNKSFTKRLKLTKRGKIIARRPGQNHFNAKERRQSQLQGKRPAPFRMTSKERGQFLGKR